MKKSNSKFFISLTVPFVAACVNPAGAVKEKALEFEAKFPERVQSMKRGDKVLQYAWSGKVERRPLLFVHGSPGSWNGWAEFLLDKRLQESFHIIVVDRPGYGGTTPDVAEPSLVNQAELIFAALSSNRSELLPILVGHSYGGPVIAKIAMLHPEKIGGLIFVASSVAPELEKTKWYQYPASWWPIRFVIPSNLRVCNEEIMALKPELTDMLPNWKIISAKTIVIHGEEDPLVPVENVDFIRDHLKEDIVLEMNRVPHLNHFIPWTRPELIENAIYKLEGALK